MPGPDPFDKEVNFGFRSLPPHPSQLYGYWATHTNSKSELQQQAKSFAQVNFDSFRCVFGLSQIVDIFESNVGKFLKILKVSECYLRGADKS